MQTVLEAAGLGLWVLYEVASSKLWCPRAACYWDPYGFWSPGHLLCLPETSSGSFWCLCHDSVTQNCLEPLKLLRRCRCISGSSQQHRCWHVKQQQALLAPSYSDLCFKGASVLNISRLLKLACSRRASELSLLVRARLFFQLWVLKL